MKKILLVAFCILALSGCDVPDSPAPTANNLPSEATEITALGNGWVRFRYKGYWYLYRQTTSLTHAGYTVHAEAITVMPNE